uniref:Uncharacterized protein n=1 Tax=Arundo donax TaxID=35708 RepID=A0A0A9HX84_ARUDO
MVIRCHVWGLDWLLFDRFGDDPLVFPFPRWKGVSLASWTFHVCNWSCFVDWQITCVHTLGPLH